MNIDTTPRLNRYIPNNELPITLRQPLKFGNHKQIRALDELEDKINKLEAEQAAITNGQQQYYEVIVKVSGSKKIKVLAINEHDAEEKAESMFDIDYDDIDIEIDTIWARKIKS